MQQHRQTNPSRTTNVKHSTEMSLCEFLSSFGVLLKFEEDGTSCIATLPQEAYELIDLWRPFGDLPSGTILPINHLSWRMFTYVAAHVEEVVNNNTMPNIRRWFTRDFGTSPSLAPNTMSIISKDLDLLFEFTDTCNYLGYHVGLEDGVMRIVDHLEGKSAREMREILGTECDFSDEELARIEREHDMERLMEDS